jgi:hypothetical protein
MQRAGFAPTPHVFQNGSVAAAISTRLSFRLLAMPPPIGAQIPGRGSAGDIFMQAQLPLHSGRIIGLTGRILVSALGVVVAMLSATGLLIWMKKARARRRSASGSKVSVGRGTIA